jgi:hypothetical protein
MVVLMRKPSSHPAQPTIPNRQAMKVIATSVEVPVRRIGV